MAFDEDLANRARELVGGERGVSEKRMFGGLAFLLDGNMAVVVRGQDGGLLVRVAEAEQDAALAEPAAAEMEMRGRPMRGWVTVTPDGCARAADLRRWVRRGVSAARQLPPK